jgi:hypothetical protein
MAGVMEEAMTVETMIHGSSQVGTLYIRERNNRERRHGRAERLIVPKIECRSKFLVLDSTSGSA